MKKKKEKTEQKETKAATKTNSQQKLTLPSQVRGRAFKGAVTKKFPTRIVIEFERFVFIPKYERYCKKKTRLHARVPQGMEVNIGDYVKIAECRPLSKIIHFIVVEKIRGAEKTNIKEEKQ
jgi:small subunit ribosomal protein S17